MKKITNIVLLALVLIAVAAVALWLFGGDAGGPNANVTPMLMVTYALLGLAVLLVVVMMIANMGKGRSNSRLGLYVFGGLAVLAVVFYFTVASGATVVGADGTVFDSLFTLKITDTMLYVTYAALGFTVVSLLLGVLYKAIK